MANKLGLNKGRYHGETIPIEDVLARCESAARRNGWTSEMIHAGGNIQLPVYYRGELGKGGSLYISAGIHGDEPAGPLSAMKLLEENCISLRHRVWILPCLNPTGFPNNTRTNARGFDLNRDYRHIETPETLAHIAWLERQPRFDVTLCLHEDWESSGFYLYELNPDNAVSLSAAMIEGAARECPIDTAEVIEDRPASGGIISPNLDPTSRPQWPEAFYLLQNKTRQSYTLEAPSDFPLEVRVKAMTAAVTAGIHLFDRTRNPS